MPLRISIKCPICGDDFVWIYDVQGDQKHRGAQGCPGGCTTIQGITINQISEERAQEELDALAHPNNRPLDALTKDE